MFKKGTSSTPQQPTEQHNLNRLVLRQCETCGVIYALPKNTLIYLFQSERPVHCPCGHAEAISDPAGKSDHLRLVTIDALVDPALPPKDSAVTLDSPRLDGILDRRNLNAVASRMAYEAATLDSPKRFICPGCKHPFQRTDHLKDHLLRIHPEILEREAGA
jgi:hypothetical protein